jgi:hypothetical protein
MAEYPYNVPAENTPPVPATNFPMGGVVPKAPVPNTPKK